MLAVPVPDGACPTNALPALTCPPLLTFKMPAPLAARMTTPLTFQLLPTPAIDAVPVADGNVPTMLAALLTMPPLLTSSVPFTSRPTSIGPATFSFDPPSATLANPNDPAGPLEITSEVASITPPESASISPDPPNPSTTAPAVQCDPAPLTMTAPFPFSDVPSPPILVAPL